MATKTADVIDRDAFPAAYDDGRSDKRDDVSSLAVLMEYIEADNIADLLDEEKLAGIGDTVMREYRIDKQSRSDWEENNAEAMKLAMQVMETKNYPWPKASNVKYPLLTSAAIQFAARAYPAIVQGSDIVKTKVVGRDDDGEKRMRGERISRHMSWQYAIQETEWEENTDKLLHVLPRC